MKLVNIIKVSVMRYLKNKTSLYSICFGVFIGVMFAINMSGGINAGNSLEGIENINIYTKNNTSKEVNLFVEELEKNGVGTTFVSEINPNKDMLILSLDDNFEKDIKEMKKPNIEVIGTKSKYERIKAQINNSLNNLIKSNLEMYDKEFLEIEIDKESEMMVLVVVTNMILLLASIFIKEIIKLKKENVVKRAMVSNNKKEIVLVGIFAGMAVILILTGITTYFIGGYLSGLEFTRVIQDILIIGAVSTLAIGITLVAVRFGKDENGASTIIVVYFLLSSGIYSLNKFIGAESIILKNLDYISVVSLVGKFESTGEFILPFIVISLMAVLTLILSGVKIENYIND